MNNETYHGIIAILLLVIAALLLTLAHQQYVTTTYVTLNQVTQEQTPFQWYCPAEPKVNCSTVESKEIIVTYVPYPKYTNESVSYNIDNPEPAPTGNPVPTIIPAPTTTMPVPEFPFLHG